MTNSIVTQVTIEAVDALQDTFTARSAARTAAYEASMARPNSLKAVQALKAALVAEEVALVAWKAAEPALQALWLAEDAAEEEARLQAMCEAHDALEMDYDGFSDHHYQLTPTGEQYLLDRHYATHSNA